MNDGGKGISDPFGIGKVGQRLVDRVFDALGLILAPWHTKRQARADAEAKRITTMADVAAKIDLARADSAIKIEQAKGDAIVRQIELVSKLELADNERRALTNGFIQQIRHQDNQERITGAALPLLTDEAQPEQLNQEWLENFYEKAKFVSGEQMQQVWAHILASEANKPGSFSRRTVNLVASLDMNEAKSFANLCRFAFIDPANVPTLAVINHDDPIYRDNGLTFASLIALDSIGLINMNPLAGFKITGISPSYHMKYFDTDIIVEIDADKPFEIQVGKAVFTDQGKQLAPICDASPVPGFIDYLFKFWKTHGVRLTQNY